VRRAMRHTRPGTKRRYQLGMADQVRKTVEKAHSRLYGGSKALHLRDSGAEKEKEVATAVCNQLREKQNLAPRARFELATLRLTAECSTVELPGNRAR
jgi:hypothetical protein